PRLHVKPDRSLPGEPDANPMDRDRLLAEWDVLAGLAVVRGRVDLVEEVDDRAAAVGVALVEEGRLHDHRRLDPDRERRRRGPGDGPVEEASLIRIGIAPEGGVDPRGEEDDPAFAEPPRDYRR